MSINSTKHIIIADNYVNGLPVFLRVVERVEIYYQGPRFFELLTMHEKSKMEGASAIRMREIGRRRTNPFPNLLAMAIDCLQCAHIMVTLLYRQSC